jgi:hypothetical protein
LAILHFIFTARSAGDLEIEQQGVSQFPGVITQ